LAKASLLVASFLLGLSLLSSMVAFLISIVV